jgi:hypothetical protein
MHPTVVDGQYTNNFYLAPFKSAEADVQAPPTPPAEPARISVGDGKHGVISEPAEAVSQEKPSVVEPVSSFIQECFVCPPSEFDHRLYKSLSSPQPHLLQLPKSASLHLHLYPRLRLHLHLRPYLCLRLHLRPHPQNRLLPPPQSWLQKAQNIRTHLLLRP